MFRITKPALRIVKTPGFVGFRRVSLFSTESTAEASKNDGTTTEKPAESEEFTKLKTKLEEKEKQVLQLQDAYRRSLADMENLRQRTKREVESASQFSIQKFAKDLLETADVLQMALDSVPKAELEGNKPLKDLYNGVSLTQKELLKSFQRFGVTHYDPLGQKFDPNLHQALFQAPHPGKEAGTVMQTSKVGYMIHERVLRPAQVGVVRE